MDKRLIAGLIAATLAATCVASAAAEPKAPPPSELAYGQDRLQRLDYWPGASRGAPLVLFVHGGGWKRGDKSMMKGSAKLSHWQALGYAVASANYRLVPGATVEQQAQDVADAVALLKRDAGRLGFDSGRIALIGHSAGAHLVALVGTDPTYLKKAGLSYADIAGIIPLDGAAYDVPTQIIEGAPQKLDTYKQAFGTDPARQRALSPTYHAAAPNAPAFLILHVQRLSGTAQSRELGTALRKAGTPADVQGFAGYGMRGHLEINRRLGESDYPATAVVDAWLATRFAK
ncbi:MAG: alpha/beta hydrolase [Erythrobacter sp.]